MEYPKGWEEHCPVPWPDPSSGPWLVTLGFGEIGGRMECVGMLITRMDKPTPSMPGVASHILTAQKVRELPVGKLIKDSRANLASLAAAHRLIGGIYRKEKRVTEAESVEAYGQRFEVPAAGRPRIYGDDHYREVAQVYSNAWRSGPSPTARVAEDFGVSRPTAARWVGECRKRGLLAPTGRGKAGGVLMFDQQEARQKSESTRTKGTATTEERGKE